MVKQTSKGWVVKSKKGKTLSKPYSTKSEAEKRLRQIEYFKKRK